MQPTRFFAPARALDDQMSSEREVAELDQVRGDLEVDVVLADLVAQDLDAAAGPFEALVRADDADVRPHEAADLVPVERHDDRVVRIGGAAVRPRRDLRGAMPRNITYGRRGTRREHHALEQRVRGKAIRAMQAGERALTDRIE